MTDTPSDLLRATPLLDFDHPTIRDLIAARGWAGLVPFGRIGAAYDFVRDEIAFGYNRYDAIPARPCWPTAMGSATPRRRC